VRHATTNWRVEAAPRRLPAGRCYRVLTAADAGVVDVDLALVPPPPPPLPPLQSQHAGGGGSAGLPPVPSGRPGPEAPLATDGTRAPDPTPGVLVPLCTSRSGDHRLQIALVEGAGVVAWQVVAAPGGRPTAVDAPGDAGGAGGTGGTAGVGGAGSGGGDLPRFAVGGMRNDFVASRIRARHGAVGEGRLPVTDLVSGTMRTSEESAIELPVEGGHCYVVLGAGVPSVAELDLRVVDAFGTELAVDAERDAFPRARFCTLAPTRVCVTVRMFRGYGPFGLQVFGGPR
jgi:hypothetical protein